MTFIELQYFVETYQLKSIVKAAEKMYVLPSVVSKAISRLESEFSVPLFYRSSNRLISSKAGDEFYQYALRLLSETNSLKDAMNKYNNNFLSFSQAKIVIDDHINSNTFLQAALASNFPNTIWEITEAINTNSFSYSDYDISIECVFQQMMQKKLISLPENYTYKQINTKTVFVWIAKDSPLNSYESLTLDLLTPYRFMIIKGKNNIFNTIRYTSGQYNPFAKNKKELVEYIEKNNCYTFEFLDDDGKPMLYDFSNTPNFSLKRLSDVRYTYIVYDKKFPDNLIAVITDVLEKLKL